MFIIIIIIIIRLGPDADRSLKIIIILYEILNKYLINLKINDEIFEGNRKPEMIKRDIQAELPWHHSKLGIGKCLLFCITYLLIKLTMDF